MVGVVTSKILIPIPIGPARITGSLFASVRVVYIERVVKGLSKRLAFIGSAARIGKRLALYGRKTLTVRPYALRRRITINIKQWFYF